MEMTAEDWARELAARGEILRKIRLQEIMTRRKNEDGTFPYLESNKKISDYLAGEKSPEIPTRIIKK